LVWLFIEPGTTGTLLFSTYIGGARKDEVEAVVVDDARDRVYIAGSTNSTDFPTLGSQIERCARNDSYDIFWTEWTRNGMHLFFVGDDNYCCALTAILGTLLRSTCVGGESMCCLFQHQYRRFL
jgi:hypothetical protein